LERKIIFLITFFVFYSILNINGDTPPAWILTPKLIYPDKDYFSSVGEGRTKDEAESNAISNISKIFETNVTVDNTFNEKTTQLNNQTSRIVNMNVNVQLRSNAKLVNVRTGEYWSGNGKHYVVAYLNKRETAKVYQSKIADNDSKIDALMRNINNTERPFDKYYYGCEAVILANENDKLHSYLILLMSPDTPPAPKHTYLSTNITIGQLLKKITMRIEIDKKYRNVEQKLSKILTNLGFSVTKNGLMNVVVEVNEIISQSDGFVYSKYSFNIDVDDGNETFFTFTRSGKVGDGSIDNLNIKVIGELGKYIEKEFEKEFVESFNDSSLKRRSSI